MNGEFARLIRRAASRRHKLMRSAGLIAAPFGCVSGGRPRGHPGATYKATGATYKATRALIGCAQSPWISRAGVRYPPLRGFTHSRWTFQRMPGSVTALTRWR